MCGISGILSFHQPLSIDRIHRMVHVLKHRGPDLEKFWEDQKVQLGHSRLKVIDLSEEASQPMCNEEEGERCVEQLDGMFAFAIWDRKKQEFFLARDRSGKKPLYYYFGQHLFA